jgi:PleD family two-component response regulator
VRLFDPAGKRVWNGTAGRGCRTAQRAVLYHSFAKFFAILGESYHSLRMTQPTALVVYEKLLPGTQLVNRLQDLNYRVRAVTDSTTLLACAQQEKPMLVVADLESTRNDICNAIAQLKKEPSTQHIPVIAIAKDGDAALMRAAQTAGATITASETAILSHLSQFLDQALQVE